MNEFIQFLDSHFAAAVFEKNVVILYVIGAIIDIFMWVVSPEKTKKAVLVFLSVVVFGVAGLLNVYIDHVNRSYAEVPNIIGSPYVNAESLLRQAGFDVGEEYSFIAKQKSEANDLGLSYFRIVRSDYAPGSVLPKGTKVTVTIGWQDPNHPNPPIPEPVYSPNVSRPDASPEEDPSLLFGDFDAWAFYGDVDVDTLYQYNASSFRLLINEASMSYMTKDYEYCLGFNPREDLYVSVTLFDYLSGQPVATKTGYYQDVSFSLEDGIYYYLVKAVGYELEAPERPFMIHRDDAPEDQLAWGVSLIRKGGELSDYFRIKLLDSKGRVMKNTKVNIRAVPSDYNGWSQFPVYSDDEGYLRAWHSIDGVEYYEPLTFAYWDGCSIELSLDEENWYPARISKNGRGTVTIP